MLEIIEDKIRLKVIFIYIIVAIICVGMIFYVFKLKKNIDIQKEKVEQYNKELMQSDQLIRSVNETQKQLNLYFSTKQYKHYRSYKSNLDSLSLQIDTILNARQGEGQGGRLEQVRKLLVDKGRILYGLNRQFQESNPIDSISIILSSIDTVMKQDSSFVISVRRDTIVQTPPKKTFWKKLSGLFSSAEEDSLVTIINETIDTVAIERIAKPDTSLLAVTKIKDIAEQAKEDYTLRMESIEYILNHLIIADQNISSEISTLLLEYYKQTAQRRIDETAKIEALVHEATTYSILSGSIALVLILLFIILIIADVNKGYKARSGLEKANEKIKQVMDSRHALLLSVSHDVKTPLSSILGTLELKKDTRELSPGELRSMVNSGEHILALLGNLLEFSSLEQGTSTLARRDFNLYELCAETLAMFMPLAQKKNLMIHADLDFDRKLVLHSDPLKIKQVISNILSNSVKYTEKGSVTMEMKYVNGAIDCVIQDTGVGIPNSQIKKLFRPFVRVDENVHMAEGSGYGLFVVRGLVDLLKGDINLTSEMGTGTRTMLTIPAEEVIREDVFKAKKILVIDDDRPYLLVIRDMLLKLGHQVEICDTKDDFVQHLSVLDAYDEVLTDMEMDSFSGFEVLKMVKEVDADMPVTIITASENVDTDRLLGMGFKAFIRKPLSFDSLYSLLGGKDISADHSFTQLEEMLGNDAEALSEVLTSFMDATEANVHKLKEALDAHNFQDAQAVAHKMLPMFTQLELTEYQETLKKMDSLRGQSEEVYALWKQDMEAFMVYAQESILLIKDYLQRLS